MIFDHEAFALDKKGKKAHESYAEKELKKRKISNKKFQELLEKGSGRLLSVADNS